VPPKKKFCSKKCGTLARVRAFRARNAYWQDAVNAQKISDELNRRSAVIQCAAGTGKLRDTGISQLNFLDRQLREVLKPIRRRFENKLKRTAKRKKEERAYLRAKFNLDILLAKEAFFKVKGVNQNQVVCNESIRMLREKSAALEQSLTQTERRAR
jgi:hypothetical protein